MGIGCPREQTCLKRIDECRPFFLCFVGQRRGWVPMPQEIHPRTLEAFPELRQHIGKASVTELEILHAILRPLHGDAPRDPARDPDYYSPADHAFFYLRDPSYLGSLPADPPELMAAYTNAGGDDPARRAHDDAELRRWREVEIPKCGRPVHHYSAQWNPALSTPELALPLVCPASAERGRERWRERWARAGVGLAPDRLHVADENQAHDFNRRLTAGRLSEFRHEGRDLAEVILDDLKRGIAARYPDHVEVEGKPGSLQAELDQQEQFLFVNSEGFIERGNDFDELDEYVRGDSRKLFVLTAEGGMGKSMLLANWIDRCRSEGSPFDGNALPVPFRRPERRFDNRGQRASLAPGRTARRAWPVARDGPSEGRAAGTARSRFRERRTRSAARNPRRSEQTARVLAGMAAQGCGAREMRHCH